MTKFDRRFLQWLGILMLMIVIVVGCAPGALPPPPAPAPTTAAGSAPSAMVNAFGVTLPPDAAPPEKQYIVTLTEEGTTCDFAVSVYKRAGSGPPYCNVLATPLLRINKNFEILPAGAESWESSPDGMTWTFHLDKNLKWSDGNPVTANDYVFTFQYQADPKHAWDFAWFWSPIKNWDKAVKGEVPVTEIGVKAVDDYTLQFTTEAAAPYLLSQALYARPLSKVAFEKNGEYYNNTPETSVSSSPWVLQEWTKGKQIVFGPNKNYTGKIKPYLEKMIITFGDSSTDFRAYQANEVDHASNFTPADIELISNDPVLSKEYHPGFGDFRTYYVGFNTLEKPFNDIKVRQAFAKAIDRDALIKNIIKRQGIAAYSFLMPGFPAANADELKNLDVNKFDPAAAKKLLADAGYPDGKDFPKMELWLRQENDLRKAIGTAIASMLKDNLGIEVEVSNKETKLFMDTLNAHTLPLYMVSYGFDYLDPSNMLGIWTSSGRHAWKNEQFDKMITEASSFSGDPAKRIQMFKDAEKLLVEDVPAVFIYHVTPGWMYKPYIKGEEFEPDKTGVTTWHWPGLEDINMMALTTYISKDVDQYRK